jgi:hypothetical protein
MLTLHYITKSDELRRRNCKIMRITHAFSSLLHKTTVLSFFNGDELESNYYNYCNLTSHYIALHYKNRPTKLHYITITWPLHYITLHDF